jgi:hypothetical protein
VKAESADRFERLGIHDFDHGSAGCRRAFQRLGERRVRGRRQPDESEVPVRKY